MSDRMEQGSWRNLAGGVLTLCLTLTGCGGGAEPPDNYGIGSDALPALTKLVALGSEMTCSVQENTQAGGDQDTDEAQGQPTYEILWARVRKPGRGRICADVGGQL